MLVLLSLSYYKPITYTPIIEPLQCFIRSFTYIHSVVIRRLLIVWIETYEVTFWTIRSNPMFPIVHEIKPAYICTSFVVR